MTIAIDAADMDSLSKRLADAAAAISGVVPGMPGASVFGPAVLAGAVASFESAMRRDAQGLHDRWAALDSGVRETLEDMSEVEAQIIASVRQTPGRHS